MALDPKYAAPVALVTGGNSFQNAAAIVPSDSTIVNVAALWVGGIGAVVVTTAQGQLVTFSAVAAGTLLPIACQKVMAATGATLIVGLW